MRFDHERCASLQAGLALGIGLALSVQCQGLKEDEVECEVAIGHLEECCPSFRPGPGNRCVDAQSGGCSGSLSSSHVIYPVLSISEAQCIRGLSCAEIGARSLCATVRALVYDEESHCTLVDSVYPYFHECPGFTPIDRHHPTVCP